ncbi:hypothetical protein [Collinsella intestinalis]|uniref:hypothetical protein n=1 Tax=Collinsella intestinalis TaxID=147207 RepID=UPI00267111B2|nr:hypothetical protein [Collinsella intestinalis]
MPTNDERREVAENLRNMCICGCRYKEEFYDLLVETVMRAWDFHEFSDVADRLADLIEPEERTCRVIMKWDGLDGRDPVCSECGTYFDDKKWHEQKFCPNCGARVVQR